MERSRLDLLLVQRGLAESREKAQALVLAGKVLLGGRPALKPGDSVSVDAELLVRAPAPYVSRGGYKLQHALQRFGVDVAGRIAIDVGASTGGFTDVLLQHGASRVYAVDVGRGQLHSRLAADRRVVVRDRVNARYLEELPERPTIATIDVSFISLRLIIPPICRLLEPGWSMIALVKPQFEAGRQQVGRGGVVRSSDTHRQVLLDLASWLSDYDLDYRGLTASPIRGASGNVEFLAWLTDAPPTSALEPEQLVEAALLETERSAPTEVS